MPSSSRSNVLYRVSDDSSTLEKYTVGDHWLLMNCWNIAPTASSEASVVMHVDAFGAGWTRRVNAVRGVVIVPGQGRFGRSKQCIERAAQPGMKRW